MRTTGWTEDRQGGTRLRIVRLLLREQLTTDALARRLGITRNAVRAQMALLLREGVAEHRGEVKGSRRPSTLYGLRPGAEEQLSRAYPLALSHLVRVLSRELDPKAFDGVMRKMGRGLAGSGPRSGAEPRDRVRDAAGFLQALGSTVEVTEQNGRFVLASDGCPIGSAVVADPRSCVSMVAMLQELTGLPVREACVHGQQPRCRFLLDGSSPRATSKAKAAHRGGGS